MRHFGLIGKRLGHSFSAKFFNSKFKAEEIDADYQLFEIDDVSQTKPTTIITWITLGPAS
mgnify:CR=1 FL=1